MTDLPELLSCPFCNVRLNYIEPNGGEATAQHPHSDDCVLSQFFLWGDEPIAAWNRRVSSIAERAEGEAVAWRWREHYNAARDDRWHLEKELPQFSYEVEIQPLFTHPSPSQVAPANPAQVTDATGQYRKKPVVIEAFQMTKERRMDNSEWPNWLHRAWNGERNEAGTLQRVDMDAPLPDLLQIVTLEGLHLVSWGDWIIRGVKGELYPCKPDIFEATYEPVIAAIGAGGQAVAQFLPTEDGEFNGNVADIVPDGCSGSALAFDPGVLHVNKDGSGYIIVREDDWQLEDDRCEGPDGLEGSVHWITHISASEMQALRDFLNGRPSPTHPSDERVVEARNYETFRTFAHEATKAITNLTGGGSEYFGKEVDGVFLADIPRCVERLRHRLDRAALSAKECRLDG